MTSILRTSALAVILSMGVRAWAQTDDLAYVPREVPERTADDVAIDLVRTTEPGIVDINLPVGTQRVDLLNATGKVMLALDLSVPPQLDLTSLRPGTWTIRAHSTHGVRVRRFVVLGNNSTMWAEQKNPRRR
jgi:hypothetical protein